VILIPILCLLLGAAIAFLVNQPLRGEFGIYIAVACLAGLDSLFGAMRSSQEGKFRTDVFVSGFAFNTLAASGLAWLGDRIGANVFLVCAFIFGTRIFNNLSLIRRHWLTQWQDAQLKKRQEALQAQAAASAPNQQAKAN